MSKDDLHQKLNRAYEITLGVKGRKSGRDIIRPVWFVQRFYSQFRALIPTGIRTC